MVCTYTFTLRCKCPVNPEVLDVYAVEVVSNEMIEVENLLALKWPDPQFQEDITQSIANRFDARVTTTGSHSTVHTVCVAEPRA